MVRTSALMAVAVLGVTVASNAETVDFRGEEAGVPPKGWLLTMTGKGAQMDGRARQ
jgi:hypothetical protein